MEKGKYVYLDVLGKGKFAMRLTQPPVHSKECSVFFYDQLLQIQVVPAGNGSVGTMLLPLLDVVGVKADEHQFYVATSDSYMLSELDEGCQLYKDLIEKFSGITIAKSIG